MRSLAKLFGTLDEIRYRRGVARRKNQKSHFRSHLVELLETRAMLTADLAIGLADAAPTTHSVAPEWFTTVSTDFGPAEIGSYSMVGPQPQFPTETLLWKGQELEARSNQWIVQLTDDATKEVGSAISATALFDDAPFVTRVVSGLGLEGSLLIETMRGTSREDAIDWLDDHESIAFIEPNALVSIDATSPNDTDFDDLWGMHNTGQTGGTADVDIDAPEAWDLTTGSSNIVVGVIDTGVDHTHPDLAANMWTNPGEIAGNGLDDDGNGLVDDIHGYDFVHDDGDPWDDHGHGTHVAGTIAGVGNNSQGVTGVSWNSQIMALKFISSANQGFTSDAVLSVNYATMMRTTYDVNVRLTNNSWGSDGYSQSLYDAISASGAADMLFVAAAGNDGTDNDITPHYPSNYDHDHLVAVAATNHNDVMAGFSNWGETSVDLAAPGVTILSTYPGAAYGYSSGTSMASPHVAGAAALAWSLSPDAANDEIRSALLDGVDPVAALSSEIATGGRLNAYQSLLQLDMHVVGSSPAADASTTSQPVDFTIDTSHPFDPLSLEATDLTVNGMVASGFTVVDSDTVEFHYLQSPVSTEGQQTMAIDAGAILRDSDGASIGDWQAVFYYDSLPLAVTATTPGEGEVLPAAPTQITFDFNEPIDTASVGIDDLLLDVGTVTAATAVDADTVAYTVANLVPEGLVTYTLPRHAIPDANGNPGADYVGHFTIDDPLVSWYSSGDVPKLIFDNTTITSTLDIPDSLPIVDVDVELDITHTWDGDLRVFLIAPNSTRVELFTEVGSNGDNFTGTILDDEASTSIADGEAPFTGRFRPEGSLAALDSLDAQGTWTLEISDVYTWDVGLLNSWGLSIEHPDITGPQVESLLPAGSAPGPISSVTVVFNETIDPTTFTSADVAIASPLGDVIALDGTLPIENSGDDQSFTLHFANPQALAGDYNVSVGPDVMDVAGNAMDQNGDGQKGQSDDLFSAEFAVDFAPQPASYFYFEGFEDVAELVPHWQFLSPGSGRIQRVDGAGDTVLRLDSSNGTAINSAVFAIDIAGQNGVHLYFNELNVGDAADPDDGLFISDDQGATWYRADPLSTPNADWQGRNIDLDAAVVDALMQKTDNFWVKFQQSGSGQWNGSGRQFDDIRVSWEGDGAKIVGGSALETAEVVQRHVFYNNSFFDDPARGSDDDAVAPQPVVNDPDEGEPDEWVDELGKTALLPGEQATFANYTSYSRGINGIMIDIARLPGQDLMATSDPLTSDFEFRVGNDNNPDAWRSSFDSVDPVPSPTVTVRPGEGVDGSDRVTLIWLDNTIEKTWLQVTVMATERTSLVSEDVFYFGNAIGDAGDWPTDARVNVFDVLGARNHLHNPRNRAPIHDRFDFDRDGLVNVFDFLIARNNSTNPRNDVKLITAPAASSQASTNLLGYELTFDEEITALPLSQISVTAPDGGTVEPLTIATIDNYTWTIRFAAQSTLGTYTIEVGTDVLDQAGNPMDQDDDGISGESLEDLFTALAILD